jgi:tetratricopeptide (TPR) repeat protein
MRPWLSLLALALLAPAVALTQEATPTPTPAPAEAAAEAPPATAPAPSGRDADFAAMLAVYAERADMAQHKAAYEQVVALAAKYKDDHDLQIFCARTAYYYGHRLIQNDQTDAGSKVASQGVRCARAARRIRDSYDARYWWVMTSVKAGASRGIRSALKAVKPMKAFLEKLIKSDPKRFEGYMCLGVLYRELPGFISWGDDEKGLEYVLKAYALAPKNPELLLELAEAYLSNDDEAKALATFEAVARSEVPEHMDWETDDARRWAKKRIDEVK